jgi:hypothetical protein
MKKNKIACPILVRICKAIFYLGIVYLWLAALIVIFWEK